MKEDVDIQNEEQDERAREPRVRKGPVVTRQDIADAAEPSRARGDGVRGESPAESAGESSTERVGLFERDRSTELQQRWTDVQARFVDDPREAVKSADALVDEVIRDLSALFSDERAKLERHWGKSEDVSTEDLRVALRRYRSFFERLLSI